MSDEIILDKNGKPRKKPGPTPAPYVDKSQGGELTAHGAERKKSGPAKGSTSCIRVESLRKVFDATLGITFEQMLANMMLSLYQDFQSGVNQDLAVRFSTNMAKQMIQPLATVMEVNTTTTNLTNDEIDERLATLLAANANMA
jgi:hypothetical protein